MCARVRVQVHLCVACAVIPEIEFDLPFVGGIFLVFGDSRAVYLSQYFIR